MSYLTMFPQLVAGPIVRYSDIEDGLARPETGLRNFSGGIVRFAAGLGKKALLADAVGRAVENLLQTPPCCPYLSSAVRRCRKRPLSFLKRGSPPACLSR